MPFHKVHLIKIPWRIAIGKNAIKTIPNLLEELGVFSAFLVHGPLTSELAGKRIEKILRINGFEVSSFIVNKADFSNVKKVEKKAKALKAQVLLGIGGGKNIDIAKTAAFKLKIPYLSIPTIPSHDGIASACSSLFKRKKKHSLFLDPPAAIVADMKYLAKAPFRFFASGAGDVIAKYTAVTDWELAKERKGEYYGEYAAQITSLAASVIMENASRYKENYESAVRLLTEALISCGYAMCIAGSSRPCSGSEHLFAHAIDWLYPSSQALHGEKVALGTLIMSYYQGKDFEFVKEVLKTLKLPTNYREIEIPRKILIKAVTHASKMRKRYTILDELKIKKGKEKEVEKVLKKLEII